MLIAFGGLFLNPGILSLNGYHPNIYGLTTSTYIVPDFGAQLFLGLSIVAHPSNPRPVQEPLSSHASCAVLLLWLLPAVSIAYKTSRGNFTLSTLTKNTLAHQAASQSLHSLKSRRGPEQRGIRAFSGE